MAYSQGSERDLYEDWKPLLEAQQDALVVVDERLEREKGWVEQTNYSVGVSAEGKFPLEKRPESPAVMRLKDEVEEWNDDREDW